MKFAYIPIENLVRTTNVREERETEMTDLESSIEKVDLLQPILVRTMKNGRYEILAGHRRVEALKLQGEDRIPCIIRDDIDDSQKLYVQLVENTSRKNMSALELVDTFEKMKKNEPKLTNREIARRIGKPEQFVTSQYTAVRMLDEMYGDDADTQGKGMTAGSVTGKYVKKQQTVYAGENMEMRYSARKITILIKGNAADVARHIADTYDLHRRHVK